ncbi:hypothetical protein BCR33DRAFT_847915 [Rhizoclosmatium globosum]|uniref:Carrier domain-containing protein n=1 Tax=Rhizoclosmatium globosum TaxID=329046 RepID=A0A1Y2CQA0_9FUNG|nr:hypothetical protein BCR33DRAFT_847915 [Rhizoclosmatium globosum]|eukprot:ORY48525.1 hypothetical protein BCR33DRAFT_847915 [Rhizoclosmatium globosum]
MFENAVVLPSYGMTECMPIATPPLTYNLEKPGTSGVSVGPEIVIKDEVFNTLPPMKFGRIMIRGPPEAFTKNGFFDTGDMGYLDNDGYLFITSRSKEVINRGGEIISPTEVEDAVLKHPKVLTAIAFSVPHDVLQETVGIVIVSRDPTCRIGLICWCYSSWPQLVVHMTDLPKNKTGKPLRIKLAERMELGSIHDGMAPGERCFEADCPPNGTPLTVSITCRPTHDADLCGHHQFATSEKTGKLEPLPRTQMSTTELYVLSAFQTVLDINNPPHILDDFFEIGGSSLTAAKIVSLVRAKYGIKMSPMTLFKCRTAKALATIVDSQATATSVSMAPTLDKKLSVTRCESPVRPLALMIQSLSVLFLQPLPIILFWLVYLRVMAGMNIILQETSHVTVFKLLVGYGLTSIVTYLCYPMLGIVIKWLIIGRYRAGKYPLWSAYYLRWWFVDQTLNFFGPGIFNATLRTQCFYLRLMGAQISSNVKFDGGTVFREFDLIRVDSGTSITSSIVRGFTIDSGIMILAPIIIGKDSVVNFDSTISPGAILPPDTVLPPRSSSHEITDSSQKHRLFASSGGPSPTIWSMITFGIPIVFLVEFIGSLPWILWLLWSVQCVMQSELSNLSSINQVVQNFFEMRRVVLLFFVLMSLRSVMSPWFKLGASIFVKQILLGPFVPGQKLSSEWHAVKQWIMKQLFGDGTLCGTYSLLGRHYESISMIYCMLGAKVGQRIYWPGIPIGFYAFDLLEVGNDVVFGSRSKLVFSDAVESRRIVIGAGCMIADRCIILPGVIVGKNAMIGSGSLLFKNGYYPPESTWIGSKGGEAVLLEEGDCVATKKEDTLKPFGKAFYYRDAPYRVFSELEIIITNMVWVCVTSCIWSMVPLIGVVVAVTTYTGDYWFSSLTWISREAVMQIMFVLTTFAASYIVTFVTLFTVIMAKWGFIGRRKPGSYDWDKSDYCQRWQLFITLQNIQGDILNNIRGSFFLVAYFRALGSKIGQRVCLYPTGGDPMVPEPDLCIIGNDTVIDRASVVAHVNSRGLFGLNLLKIGDGCVLRTDSRLLSGGEMENESKLLEHTLIVGGEVVHSGSVMQGWPAHEIEGND